MTRNIGTWDRILRALAGAALLAGSFVMPLALIIRVLVFGCMGAYLLMTALSGTCVCYGMLGKSTCALHPKDGAS